MQRAILLCLCFTLQIHFSKAQTNISVTNPEAEQVLLGNYNPALYTATEIQPPQPDALARDLESAISADTLKASILQLSTFRTRHSSSDTNSSLYGIGAARRWTYAQFARYGDLNQHRLIPAYLQFDQDMCGVIRHRNIFAVLPGSDPASGVVLVEGHIDSRCSAPCDSLCLAEGVEDNATGTALVLEMARVMSKYQFRNTVVFLVTIGEEQGLYGAEAFAAYAQQKNIPLRAVFNNDVIGGVICGKTSSPPSCPGLNDIDSTSVRLFSAGSFNSKSKQLARFIKLQYREDLLPTVSVPMNVRIMSPEDRTGRGGDHIPFREHGYAAMRFTAANEHGDASNGAGYTDRQHSSSDVLGVDTDADGAVDSFFVDFHYLARNTVINATGLAMAARGVGPAPDFTAYRNGSQLTVIFNTPIDTQTIRVAVRSTATDWDTVFTISLAFSDVLGCKPTGPVYVSVAGVDYWGTESLFSGEKIATLSGTEDPLGEKSQSNYRLFQNRPNPFDEATWISFWVNELPASKHEATVQIADIQGRIVENLPIELKQGLNEVLYTHGYGVSGIFTYSLKIDGKVVDSRQMIFAN